MLALGAVAMQREPAFLEGLGQLQLAAGQLAAAAATLAEVVGYRPDSKVARAALALSLLLACIAAPADGAN